MKFLVKMGEMKPENIVKGIFICVAILIIYKIPILNLIILRGRTIVTHFMSNVIHIQYYLEIIGSAIIYLILLRLFCEVLYNIISAAQVIIKRNNK